MTDLKVLIPKEEIAKRVAELGAAITRDYAGQSVIFVGVLKGAQEWLGLYRRSEVDERCRSVHER